MSPAIKPYPTRMVEDAIHALLVFYSAIEAPINEADIKDRSRDAYTIKVRAVLFYFLKVEGHLSYPAIGKRFGRDHTSVLSLVRRVHDLVPLEDLDEVCDYVKEVVSDKMLARHAQLMEQGA